MCYNFQAVLKIIKKAANELLKRSIKIYYKNGKPSQKPHQKKQFLWINL